MSKHVSDDLKLRAVQPKEELYEHKSITLYELENHPTKRKQIMFNEQDNNIFNTRKSR